MAYVLFVAISINVALFAALAAWSVRYAVREELPRLRPLAWGLAAVAAAFVLGAVTRLLLVGVRLGWVDGRVSDFLLSEWHLIQSLAATAAGIAGLLVFRRFARSLRRADRLVSALSDRLPTDADLAELGLTAREREVLAVIAGGKLSDQEIADELFISPATAGTHIKNMLRKTGMSNRRDLALLAVAQAP